MGAGAVSVNGGTLNANFPESVAAATLNSGLLVLNNNSGAGAGALTIAGGALDSTNGGVVLTNSAQSWNGDFTFTGSNALNLGTGNVTMSASRQVTTSASTLTIGGAISGAGFGITKLGPGTLTIPGNSTYTGNVTISAGTLATDTSGLGGSTQLIFNGGTLQAVGTLSSANTRAVTLSAPATIDTNGNTVSIAGAIGSSAAAWAGKSCVSPPIVSEPEPAKE